MTGPTGGRASGSDCWNSSQSGDPPSTRSGTPTALGSVGLTCTVPDGADATAPAIQSSTKQSATGVTFLVTTILHPLVATSTCERAAGLTDSLRPRVRR